MFKSQCYMSTSYNCCLALGGGSGWAATVLGSGERSVDFCLTKLDRLMVGCKKAQAYDHYTTCTADGTVLCPRARLPHYCNSQHLYSGKRGGVEFLNPRKWLPPSSSLRLLRRLRRLPALPPRSLRLLPPQARTPRRRRPRRQPPWSRTRWNCRSSTRGGRLKMTAPAAAMMEWMVALHVLPRVVLCRMPRQC